MSAPFATLKPSLLPLQIETFASFIRLVVQVGRAVSSR